MSGASSTARIARSPTNPRERAGSPGAGDGDAESIVEAACARAAQGRGTEAAILLVKAGRLLEIEGRFEEALAVLQGALDQDPANPDAYAALGIVHEGQGNIFEAFRAYQKTIELRPQDVMAYNNIAALLVHAGQLDMAIATARLAVALAPDNPGVYLNLAVAQRLSGDDAAAIATYRTILALDPGQGQAMVDLCHRRQHACDWAGLADDQVAAWASSYRIGKPVSPFVIMTMGAPPAEQLACAQVWARSLEPISNRPLVGAAPRTAARRRRPLRIAYLSADFHNHATAMLIAGLLEHHDAERFHLFGYSIGADDGSAMRRRLMRSFRTFVDLQPIADAEAAKRIHADEIDILLDLKGFTQNARIKILAYRPAPVQVNFLGFPGTMGAPFVDYIVADRHVAPMEHQPFFSERIVHLPGCYQPNDDKRSLERGALRRADHGLPDEGFVFCSFNSPYKITPALFDIWMRLLRGAPGSVLWLLATNTTVADNLGREAGARGVPASRLVFAPFAAPEDHLARLALADLFLDTLPVNAHTTASEALWMGLPVLTCVAENFASRVAASLLHAVALPDMVQTSLEGYEATAARIARDPREAARLRRHLEDNRATFPLFDTAAYARGFESALTRMMERYDAGLPPAAFAV